jgi:Tol biopolymer transport system component
MGPSAPNARHTAATGGTGQTQLTFNSVEDRGPQWSPDGSKIVWARDLDGGTFDNSEIFLMNADGTGTQQLKFNGHFDCYPRSRRTARRSRTSRSRAAGSYDIWKMNADGTGQTPVASTGYTRSSRTGLPTARRSSSSRTSVTDRDGPRT